MSESIRPMKFVSFDVQRCIKVIYDGEGHILRPIDPCQVEAVLEPVAHNIGFGPHDNLHLIETETVGGAHALVDHCDGEIYLLADAELDPSCVVSTGTFGGVWWRVIGFEEGFPNEPYELASGDCEQAIRIMCAGLQALLQPVQVVVSMHGGTIEMTVADRPAEVMLIESYRDDVRAAKADGGLVVSDANSTAPQEYVANHTEANIDGEKVNHFWSQLPS